MARGKRFERTGFDIVVLESPAGNTIWLISGSSTSTTQIAAEMTEQPPVGSLYVATDGKLYQHISAGTAAANWGEVGLTAGVTAGTVTASKAVVVDSNKDAASFRNVTVANLDAGASGTAGTVDVFPGTASKGKLAITCTNQTGNTTVTLNAEAMGQATNIGIPDPGGADADVVLTAGAQTVNGVKTFGSAPVMSGASITSGTIPSAALAANAGLAAMVTAGLGNSAAYVRTDSGTKTLLAANASKARGVLVVVHIDTTFANGDGGQPTIQIGEADTDNKCFDTTDFTDATAGTVKVKGFLNTSTKAITATLVAATGATSTGAATITVLALPNS